MAWHGAPPPQTHSFMRMRTTARPRVQAARAPGYPAFSVETNTNPPARPQGETSAAASGPMDPHSSSSQQSPQRMPNAPRINSSMHLGPCSNGRPPDLFIYPTARTTGNGWPISWQYIPRTALNGASISEPPSPPTSVFPRHFLHRRDSHNDTALKHKLDRGTLKAYARCTRRYYLQIRQ